MLSARKKFTTRERERRKRVVLMKNVIWEPNQKPVTKARARTEAGKKAEKRKPNTFFWP